MKSFLFICAIVFVVCASSFIFAQDDIDPEEMKQLLQQREEAERAILNLARSKIGEKMRPQHLVNYVLNPKKNIDRFAIEDHLKMQETGSGLFVVDKRAEHIGIMTPEGIIHAAKKNDFVVKEEKTEEARKSFPNGWKRVGPDGILKTKFSFQQQMNDILKQATGGGGAAVDPNAASASKGSKYAGATAGKATKQKQQNQEVCPDCVKDAEMKKKKNADL